MLGTEHTARCRPELDEEPPGRPAVRGGAAPARGLAPALTYCLGGFPGLYTPFTDLSSESETTRPAKLKHLPCGLFRESPRTPELFRGSSNSVSQVLRPGLASPPRCPPPVSVREPRERPARPSSRRAGHVGPAQSLRWLLTRPGPHPEASTASPGALSPGPPAAGPRPTAWHRLPRALHVLLPRGP